ncbi:hypothetical protein GCM10027199_43550 [Amycolatopsis magusensis]
MEAFAVFLAVDRGAVGGSGRMLPVSARAAVGLVVGAGGCFWWGAWVAVAWWGGWGASVTNVALGAESAPKATFVSLGARGSAGCRECGFHGIDPGLRRGSQVERRRRRKRCCGSEPGSVRASR